MKTNMNWEFSKGLNQNLMKEFVLETSILMLNYLSLKRHEM